MEADGKAGLRSLFGCQIFLEVKKEAWAIMESFGYFVIYQGAGMI